MIIGVDHVLIAVENMEEATESYRRLGFEVMAGGEHPRMGTFNALAPLADGTYLELIGVRDKELARQFANTRLVVAALKGAERLATFALDTNNLQADVEGIRARGLKIGDPVEGERMRPDGKQVKWRSAHPVDSYLPFLIQDITPRQVRVPLPDKGLGERAYLAEIQVAAPDVADVARLWKNLLGRIPPDDDLFPLERSTVRLVGADGSRPGIRSLTLAVDELERRVRDLVASGIAVRERDGRAELDPQFTAGANIALVSHPPA